ncbi:putative membrane-anchored protein YitT [Candidatus Electrothrix marina]|uniref:Putative membrane-anchored protein YitT n=2 Tax=Candidatus Electrothrix marina TaxID=1859130 RepID=A0A3S3U8J5_9BACT|nr:putative membrane-anchored protein YitT [Candidatus Electrothrix marina]
MRQGFVLGIFHMRTGGNPQALFLSPWQVIRDIGLLCLGGVLCAVGVNSILIPHNFVTGGITGIALIVYKIFPFLDPGVIYLLLNLPLFALAWMVVGRRFFVYSILGTVALSVSLLFFHFDLQIEDRMLNALLAGVILGVGAGLCLKTSGSQGGTDMLSVVLLKRFSIKIGNTLMVLNGLVLLLISVYYSIEAVLYTMIVVFVSSKVINLVVVGLSQRKAVFIISRHWDYISREILKDIRRGVTIIKGEGGYSRKEEKILYTVVQLTEIGTLKRLVHGIDPDAFVVISDTLEVINYRIGNQPHW